MQGKPLSYAGKTTELCRELVVCQQPIVSQAVQSCSVGFSCTTM